MMKMKNNLNAKDFSNFEFYKNKDDKDEKTENVQKNEKLIFDFTKEFSQKSILNFSTKYRDEEIDFQEEPFALYNYKEKKWFAGRWVGSANYGNYSIEIKPRFGEIVLFSMLEEIFSVNILENNTKPEQTDIQNLLNRLIPYIWTKKLGNANKYGVPKHNITKSFQGQVIKGRIDIRHSILPFFQRKEVVSVYNEKVVDESIANVILQAKNILRKRTGDKNFYKHNENAYNAVLNFESSLQFLKNITENEVKNIRYKSIYQPFKDIVDFSWNIIKNKHFNQEDDSDNKGYCLFVDMAEIWELYLLSLLKREFPDWSINSPKLKIYNEPLQNHLIPDIVMSRGNDVVIFDAKWKRMIFNKFDIDRVDFFQIHTYISYYQNIEMKNVIAGGLLYPCSKPLQIDLLHINEHLFGNVDRKTRFIVDGIDLSGFVNKNGVKKLTKEETEKQMKEQIEELVNQEEKFIKRINNILK